MTTSNKIWKIGWRGIGLRIVNDLTWKNGTIQDIDNEEFALDLRTQPGDHFFLDGIIEPSLAEEPPPEPEPELEPGHDGDGGDNNGKKKKKK